MSDSAPVLVWFRNDLRLDDHPALAWAAASGRPVVPVVLRFDDQEGDWPRGGASNWWLHHALADLRSALRAEGSDLVLRSGPDAEDLVRGLMKETGADLVVWNRRYEPRHVELDTRLKRELPSRSFAGSVLWEPGTVRTGSDDPYKVFTPFYKACLAGPEPEEPVDAPSAWTSPASFPASESLEDWGLLPRIGWDAEFHETWDPTQAGAAEQLETFLDEAAGDYKQRRDTPSERGTSRLSPFLHFGQISPRRIWHEAKAMAAAEGGGVGVEAWLRQVVWRDFAIQMLFHFPHTDREPLQEKFSAFPWREDPEALRAWRRGETGYPLVDAGMRELWATGWMHNRVRMVVASFLVKHLLIHWREGAAWFWDTLVDADLANNSFGWQWTAGCGADAAPYFRIFNPILQSKRFDPEGAYIRRWVPELRGLSNDDIHEPWNAPMLAPDYPPPMVDHAAARDWALEALGEITD